MLYQRNGVCCRVCLALLCNLMGAIEETSKTEDEEERKGKGGYSYRTENGNGISHDIQFISSQFSTLVSERIAVR